MGTLSYFDLRGITNGAYKLGDDWIRAASESSRVYGFETIVDNNPDLFPDAFPMSQIALYAGWYSWNVWGPFTRPKVEFMEGAFAYHLHSFSATTLRSPFKSWCGPLIAAGATATMGCVDEPFLEGTPNIGVFFDRWLSGYSFGEAAYICQKTISWQTTVIGDPLYRPFGQDPRSAPRNVGAHAQQIDRVVALARHQPRFKPWNENRKVNRLPEKPRRTPRTAPYFDREVGGSL